LWTPLPHLQRNEKIVVDEIGGLLVDIFTCFKQFLEEESAPVQLSTFYAMLCD